MVGAVMHKCFGDDADGDLIWISCKVNEWGVCIFWGGTLVGGGEGCNRIYYFAGEFEYIDLVCWMVGLVLEGQGFVAIFPVPHWDLSR